MISSSPNRRGRSTFFLGGSSEGLPVVRHRLGQLEELGGQVLRSIELDPQLAGLQRNISGEIPHPAVPRVGGGRERAISWAAGQPDRGKTG
jgi:hypothetical protein